MNAYCPTCETDLDQATGICPACRWDPYVATSAQPVQESGPELSLTERYRGTQFDITVSEQATRRSELSRGRSFVVVTLVAGAALYGVVMTMMGPIF
jgi:hypothetical protein